MNQESIDAFMKLEKEMRSIMPVYYTKTEDDVNKIIKEVEAKGKHRFAALSNTGLKEGFRITFLPKSVFKDDNSTDHTFPKCKKEPVDVREFIKELK